MWLKRSNTKTALAIEPFCIYRGDEGRTGRIRFLGPSQPRVLKKVKLDRQIKAPAACLPDGRMAVGTVMGSLFVLKPDGEIEKKIKLDSWVLGSPAVDSKGNIYVGTDGGFFYCISPEGDIIWKNRTNAEISSSPLIFQKKLFLGSEDNHLYAFQNKGKLGWKYNTRGRIVLSSPAVGKNSDIYRLRQRASLPGEIKRSARMDGESRREAGRLYTCRGR